MTNLKGPPATSNARSTTSEGAWAFLKKIMLLYTSIIVSMRKASKTTRTESKNGYIIKKENNAASALFSLLYTPLFARIIIAIIIIHVSELCEKR